MKRIARLLCSFVLLFAMILSASGMVHATGGHESHIAAMSTSAVAPDSHGGHASDETLTSHGEHGGEQTTDLLSCCATMAGACAGFMAFLPTTTAGEPLTGIVASYPILKFRLSGIDPDSDFRPPRA